MPCGSRKSATAGWGVRTWVWDWEKGRVASPLERCHRPLPHPPGGPRAGGPFVASALSACPAGSGGWARLGTGCRTQSQLWPEGTQRAPDEEPAQTHTTPSPDAPRPAPEERLSNPWPTRGGGGGASRFHLPLGPALCAAPGGPADASSTQVGGLQVEGMPPEGIVLKSSGTPALLG